MHEVKDFIPEGMEALDVLRGDLTGDGRSDALLIATAPSKSGEKLGQGQPRIVILIVQDKDGSLRQAGRNAKIVPCERCGGIAGDPYAYARIENGTSSSLSRAARASDGQMTIASATSPRRRLGCWTTWSAKSPIPRATNTSASNLDQRTWVLSHSPISIRRAFPRSSLRTERWAWDAGSKEVMACADRQALSFNVAEK